MSSEFSGIYSKIKKFHLIILAFALLLIAFCIRWQVVEASRFNEIAKGRVLSTEIDSMRGTIYANDGSTLAVSEPRFDMFIWYDDLTYIEEHDLITREEFLQKVAPILGITPSELNTKMENYLKAGVKWMPLAKSLDNEQWQKLTDLRTDKYKMQFINQSNFEYTSKRIYPEGRLASQLLGFTNMHNDKIIGEGGLEGYWNGVLNPIKGYLTQETDAIGQAVAAALLRTIEPKNGSSIYTSIDKKLQGVVEAKIKEGVEMYQAKTGTVIIMDPKTSQILALANYPDFDPNLREEKDANVYGDIAASAPYEIGSVGKAFTIATALDLGVVTPDTIILPNGHQGCEKIHQDLEPVCTWDRKPQPPMPLKDCFAKSDNLCLYHLAAQLQRKDFYDYLVKFGAGQKTGVDIANEFIGNLKSYTEWNVGDVAAFSYGHGYEMNSIQEIDGISAIANYGVRMAPYVVTKVVDGNGKENIYNPVALGRVIKRESAETLVSMMSYNYKSAIAPNEYQYYHLKRYNLGVKSGTALIANSTGYSTNINATFVGFDASPDRKFIMLVRLEDPKIPSYDRLAFYNVRPLWLDTFDAVKDMLGVQPSQ